MTMPIAVVRAYSVMLPRLEAAESFLVVERAQVGSGLMERRDSRRIVDRWRSQERGGRAAPTVKRKLSPVVLAAMGIAYHQVPRG